jgi:dihydrolipoamide dehydrogenase
LSQDIYDLIVIGAGPGGYHSALRAAQYGAEVAIIEREHLGGTCTNYGCIPTKALYTSSLLLEEIQEKAESLGINIDGEVNVDFGKMVDRKNQVVQELRAGIEGLLNVRKISILHGFGRIEGGNITDGFTVSYTNEEEVKQNIKGKRVLIATGSTPMLIPAFNIDHDRILTSDDILSPDFKTVPKSLLIIGAGVIGCEFANIFSRIGVKVTMLEYLPTMLATEEKLVIKELKKKFAKMGIEVNTNRNVLNVETTADGIKATTCDASVPRDQTESAEKSIFEAEYCLVSIGRAKLSSNIGFVEMGGKTERSAIVVNKDTMESSIEGVYAIGDVNDSGMMLAHVASYEGDIAISNLLSSIGGFDIKPRTTDYTVVPYTIFTNPEIGSVGIREKQAKALAKEKGTKVYTGRFMYSSLGKAKCMAAEEGFLMITADKETGKILGASCIGHEAPELISEIALAMKNGITAQQIGHTIHSHPTISEMVLEAAEDVFGMAIHKAARRR